MVFAGCLCLIGEAIGTYVFTPLLKPIVADLGWTRTQFTLSGLWVSLVMMLAVPAAGRLADRGCARGVLAFGAFCLGVAMFLFARTQSLQQFYLFTVVMGLGVGCVGGVPASTLVTRWVVSGRGTALGVMGFGHSVGGLLLPPALTWITAQYGWRTAFQCLGYFVWGVMLPLIVLLVRDAPVPHRADPEGAVGTGHIPFWDGVRSPTFALLASVMFLHIFYFSGITVHFVAFATDVGFAADTAATAFGALVGLGIVGRLLFGWAADHFARQWVMLSALVLTVVAALLLQRITTPGVLPAFIVLHGVSVVGVQTVFALLVADCFGVASVGTFLGATMLFQVPGGVLGAIMAAASFDRLGSYGPVFWLFALGNLVAAGAITIVRPYGPVPPAAPNT